MRILFAAVHESASGTSRTFRDAFAPLMGVEQTFRQIGQNDANDPKRT
jgi:hypothetical protein